MKIIALVEGVHHVSARYRIAAFAPALKAADCCLMFGAIPRSPLRRLILFSKIKAFDTVLLQRRLLPTYQLKYLRRNARRLIFDFDDAVFCHDSYDPRGLISVQRELQFRQMVCAADGVITGNEFLKEQAIAKGVPNSCVRVVPTCIEPGRYVAASHVPKKALNLVWIGSSSTLQGLERRRDLLEKLGREFPHLRLRLICDRFPDLARPPVDSIRWSEALEAAELASGDIGISLLPDDLWSKGKCGLKILQYYAAGLPVIASSVGIHAEMIESGVTGFLADTDEQWIKAVSVLSDPQNRERMGAAARRYVEHYSIAAHSHSFVEIVKGERPARPEKASRVSKERC